MSVSNATSGTPTPPTPALQRESDWIEADIDQAEAFGSHVFPAVAGAFAAMMIMVAARGMRAVLTAKINLETANERAKQRKELDSAITELETLMTGETGTIEQIQDATKKAKAIALVYKINFLANQLGYCPYVGQVDPVNFEPPPERKFGLVGDSTVVTLAFNGPDAQANAEEVAREAAIRSASIIEWGTTDDITVFDVQFQGASERIGWAELGIIAGTGGGPVGVYDRKTLGQFIDNLDVFRARIEKSGSPEEREVLAKFDRAFSQSCGSILTTISPDYTRSVTNGLSLSSNIAVIRGAQQRVRSDVAGDGENISQLGSSLANKTGEQSSLVQMANNLIDSLAKDLAKIMGNFLG